VATPGREQHDYELDSGAKKTRGRTAEFRPRISVREETLAMAKSAVGAGIDLRGRRQPGKFNDSSDYAPRRIWN
jgi:hypothetical protein